MALDLLHNQSFNLCEIYVTTLHTNVAIHACMMGVNSIQAYLSVKDIRPKYNLNADSYVKRLHKGKDDDQLVDGSKCACVCLY